MKRQCLSTTSHKMMSFQFKTIVAIVVYVTITTYSLNHQALAVNVTAVCEQAGVLGFVCQTCLVTARCQRNTTAEGGWTITTTGTCPAGKVCNAGRCVGDAACTPTTTPDFLCATTGMFPDPYDCKMYHFCPPGANVSTPATCGTDGVPQYGYNPVTTFCSNKLANNKCTSVPIPICRNLFDTGIVGGNPSLYYFCSNAITNGQLTDELYPYQYACEFGRKYNTASLDCK
ncbi:hypothetical protein PPYR_13721 [Photinus pyralis]|uniref:Chitin-binding type-2 domain-containing protein n=1 Tax=Photinus pyralis TaxID=7054 RepID=A0A5N4A9V0_PHOPY|nr:uncharacterized protein LOC116179031 [Photinus pyralis]KAB0794101.1 hypothetical protein PPYR_13721 [Photinus pyralis]